MAHADPRMSLTMRHVDDGPGEDSRHERTPGDGTPTRA